MTQNNTILYFHTGRGGSFNNAGHVTFEGVRNLAEVLNLCDSGGQWSFLNKENYGKISMMLKERGLENLLNLLERSTDANDFTEFEAKTGLDLGEDVYLDGQGNLIITAEDLNKGVGQLEWDYAYDTDTCTYLRDCSEQELKLVAERDTDLIEEYFNECTDLTVDWSRFNGEYSELITDYFFGGKVDLDDFYEEVEEMED